MDEKFEIDPQPLPERDLVKCDVTGKWVSPEDIVEIQGFRVCAEGKELLLDRLRSGEAVSPGTWSGEDVWHPTHIDATDIINRAWQIYREKMGICIAVVFFCLLINQGSAFLVGIVQGVMSGIGIDPSIVLPVYLLLTLMQYVLNLWLTLGQTIFLLNIALGREAAFGDVFSGGRFLLRYVGASIVYGMAIAAAMLVVLIPVGIMAAVGGQRFGLVFPIAMVVGMIPAMIVAIMYLFYSYAIIDQDATATGSLNMSKELTSGNKGQLVLLFVASALFIIVGLLACLVGVLVAAPFVFLLVAVAYVAMTGRRTAEQRAMA